MQPSLSGYCGNRWRLTLAAGLVNIAALAGAGALTFCVAGCHSSGGSDNESAAAVSMENAMGQNDHPASPGKSSGSASGQAAAIGVPEEGQATFASPQEAVSSLKLAVDAKDRHRLVAIFGQEGRALIFTGDRVQEGNEMSRFAQHLAEYMHIDRVTPAKAVLYMGKNNWPFPIPIVQSNGQWFFDTAAGKDEILDRRIGEDELTAIDVCRAYVEAQKEYAQQPRVGEVIQYAQHFMSSPGTKNGLYWPEESGQMSPMGPLVAEARLEGYTPGENPAATQSAQGGQSAHPHHPYHGYIFHILKAQGADAPGGEMDYVVDGKMTKGFALIAFPDKWDASGVMTFIVNQDGKVSQKNLGPDTRKTAAAITEYNPDSSWTLVKD